MALDDLLPTCRSLRKLKGNQTDVQATPLQYTNKNGAEQRLDRNEIASLLKINVSVSIQINVKMYLFHFYSHKF